MDVMPWSHAIHPHSFLAAQTNKDGSGMMKLGGSLTRQAEQDFTVSDTSPHVANIGHMVEVSVGGCFFF